MGSDRGGEGWLGGHGAQHAALKVKQGGREKGLGTVACLLGQVWVGVAGEPTQTRVKDLVAGQLAKDPGDEGDCGRKLSQLLVGCTPSKASPTCFEGET